eukprot:TRINITY_DN7227_c1_g1_i1.p1 TRINITY_DN7227_c1_g1~~TRINITY_DN7227_c1_g1_i1.p1  ORF type:complete len:388 (+),score=16.86 TRINITY_DN7227_c1_g1_i1:140-1303(+)
MGSAASAYDLRTTREGSEPRRASEPLPRERSRRRSKRKRQLTPPVSDDDEGPPKRAVEAAWARGDMVDLGDSRTLVLCKQRRLEFFVSCEWIRSVTGIRYFQSDDGSVQLFSRNGEPLSEMPESEHALNVSYDLARLCDRARIQHNVWHHALTRPFQLQEQIAVCDRCGLSSLSDSYTAFCSVSQIMHKPRPRDPPVPLAESVSVTASSSQSRRSSSPRQWSCATALPPGAAQVASPTDDSQLVKDWKCAACTYDNPDYQDCCLVCGLPACCTQSAKLPQLVPRGFCTGTGTPSQGIPSPRLVRGGTLPSLDSSVGPSESSESTAGWHSPALPALSKSALCPLCGENDRNTVLMPCRHLAVCAGCAPKGTHCPTCSDPVTHRLVVHC